jgi:hypothetical protein
MDSSPPDSEYVQPADRETAWAAMAAGLANDGYTPAQIADALCVDEPTAVRLLAHAGRVA